MTDTAAQLLATFESLPRAEQHELLVTLLRTAEELPDSLLSEEHSLVIAQKACPGLRQSIPDSP